MSELLRFETEGGSILVEVDPTEPGFDRVARPDVVAQAQHGFEASLSSVRDAAAAALRVFQDGSLRPDRIDIEFGVRLNAEAGAVIAKTAMEGHLIVRLAWHSGTAAGRPE
jgi:hypothetical protein